IDAGRLADVLALNATALRGTRRRRVLLIGFVELSPQQTRLEAALTAAGAVHFERVDPLPTEQGRAWRATGTTSRDEIARALAWARRQIVARPSTVVGIAIEDLTRRRAETRTLAEEILCPALQWPGSESEPRPFNISLGDSLAATPLVSSAL